jgi:hypothetical protein
MEPQQANNSEEQEPRYDLEVEKLKLEKEKLKVERMKAIWSAISIVVPLIAATATIFYGIWSQRQQASSQFEIKAAELVMSTESPLQAKDKAKALRALFPDRISQEFCDSFNPGNFPNYSPDIIGAKQELLRMLVGKSQKEKQEILSVWKKLFPDDNTAERFK